MRIRFAGFAMLAASVPLAAHANVGVGVLSHWIPAAILALVPAILIEAPVLARLLGIRAARALWLSSCANLASAILGLVIAGAGDIFIFGTGSEEGREPMLVALAPMFVATWVIEMLVVRAMERKAARVPRATFAANALTYVLMAIAVVALVPPTGTFASRWRVQEAVTQVMVLKTLVAEHHTAKGLFPPPQQHPSSGHLRSLRTEANGRIVGEFSFPNSPDAHGKHLIVEPRVVGGRITEWVCYTPDMHFKYLPATCRQRAP